VKLAKQLRCVDSMKSASDILKLTNDIGKYEVFAK